MITIAIYPFQINVISISKRHAFILKSSRISFNSQLLFSKFVRQNKLRQAKRNYYLPLVLHANGPQG